MSTESSSGIKAKMICDSISPDGIRLSTIQVTLPKLLLGQAYTHRIINIEDIEIEVRENISINTHKEFSRNAASSRAIPTKTLLERINNKPVIPVYWGKNKPGMQADEEISDKDYAYSLWIGAVEEAMDNAKFLHMAGVHKQITNRLLEPFMYVDVLITATEWDNFFNLRLHDATQPEMQVVANSMKEAMDHSIPTLLNPGEWHLPYVKHNHEITNECGDDYLISDEEEIKCSVARCARISYLNHDQSSPDLEKDLKLYELLLKEKHLSPFEHQARPMYHFDSNKKYHIDFWSTEIGVTHQDKHGDLWSGNLRGWIQNRQLL